MYRLDSLYGNEHIKKTLNMSSGFRTFLIEGEKGSGRHTLARLLAKAALCSAESAPCGDCPSCKRFDAGSNLDFISLDAGQKPEIKVGSLREILADVAVYPACGKNKVYFIDNADRLSVLCQNILLKTLEEPPEFVTFILVVSAKEAMLETVRSRCVSFTMMPMPEETVSSALCDRLRNPDPVKLRRSVMLSEGYVGVALSVYESNKTDLFDRCGQFAECYCDGSWMKLFEVLTFSGKTARADFCEFIRAMSLYAKRCFLYSLHGRKDGVEGSEKRLTDLGTENLLRLCRALDEVLKSCDSNVNIALWSAYVIKQCRNARQK